MTEERPDPESGAPDAPLEPSDSAAGDGVGAGVHGRREAEPAGSERFAGLGEAIAAASAEVQAEAGGAAIPAGDSQAELHESAEESLGEVDDESDDDAEAAAQQLLDDLDRLQGERNEYLEQLIRTKADFENYRKRVLKQQAEQVERAAEELVEKLIDVLDVYDGAKAHAEGFEQVGATLVTLLEKEGLARIDPVGATFDPTESDAVMHEEGEGGPVVSDVLRPGYRWKGRVLRPAMVKVKG